MKMLGPALLLLAATAACATDESVRAYGAADGTWRLQSLDGAAFAARADLRFPAPGQIAGTAPCNQFAGPQSAPYPWFDAGPLTVTRRACPDLAAETAFLSALTAMTLAEVSGDTLILSDEAGREMIFSRQPDG